LTNQKHTISIATVNTFFDGISTRNMSFAKWIWVHIYTFLRLRFKIRKAQIKRKDDHPIEQVIKYHNPTIINANEVINAKWGSDSFKLLKNSGYEQMVVGASPTPKNNLTRLNLVACRAPGKRIKMGIENEDGGRFCCFELERTGTQIIGVLASPFYPTPRTKQIKSVIEYGIEQMNNGKRVVIMGDMNCELEDLPFYDKITEHFQVVTDGTFPNPELMEAINRVWQPFRWLSKYVLSINKGYQKLDYILIPKSVKIYDSHTVTTVSDHRSIVVEVDPDEL
jgi:hypothetical protein